MRAATGNSKMKLITRFTIGLIGILFCSKLAIIGCYALESPERHFANYDEVDADEPIHRGWMPPIFPKSAFQIHEKHNFDSNETLWAFRFDNGFNQTLKEQCEQVTDAKTIQWPFINTNWWPNDLRGSASVHPYIFYKCQEHTFNSYFAITATSKEAYFWRTR